jgi:hypothetical protein
MIAWARGSYEWARSDSRIVGLTPWYYDEGPPPFVPGLAGMPSVLQTWITIGREILSGRLGNL